MAKEIFSATTAMEQGKTLKVSCTARDMGFVLDEPVSLGGTDQGMNPVEGLLSALGACKCIVIKAFAAAQGMDISDVAIDLDGTLDPDGFLGKNPDAKIGFSKIHMTYRLTTTNSADEVDRFLEFVDSHCPVMDTLVNTPAFEHAVELA